MRKVIVFEHKKAEGQSHWDKVEKCEALFHEFGVDYEELENGTGNFSTGIVEYKDGTVDNISVNLLKFMDLPI